MMISSPGSSLLSFSSGTSGTQPPKVVDILLAAHRQLTEREFDFTLVMLDTLLHLAVNPLLPVPAVLIDKAAANPDLVYAVVTSPDVQYQTDGLEVRQFFGDLVRSIARRFCSGDSRLTLDSYASAIEHLTRRPAELAATHERYRSEPEYTMQPNFKSLKGRSKWNGVALAVLSVFLTKKEWREAKKRASEGKRW
ncbi:hypothetical protein RhiJN_02229 [Ceratobasidium sp. AG-Ba]|nr:hypothetical protein RhiJN_02229 [Ceratobasidium sp. AG-Ba]